MSLKHVTTVRRIAMKFGTDIYVPRNMNCNKFISFHLLSILELETKRPHKVVSCEPQLYFVFQANCQMLL